MAQARQGRTLSLEEVRAYCRIVTALIRTMEIQRAIADLYPEVEAGALALALVGDG